MPRCPDIPSYCVSACISPSPSLLHFLAPLMEGLRNRQEDLLKAGTPEAILRREVGSAEKRFALRGQKDSQRPAPLSADCRYRRLVARVHIRTLIAIYLYGDEVGIQNRGDLSGLI